MQYDEMHALLCGAWIEINNMPMNDFYKSIYSEIAKFLTDDSDDDLSEYCLEIGLHVEVMLRAQAEIERLIRQQVQGSIV
jgi:hypothetical protein